MHSGLRSQTTTIQYTRNSPPSNLLMAPLGLARTVISSHCAITPVPSTRTTAKKKQFGRRWRPCHLRQPQRNFTSVPRGRQGKGPKNVPVCRSKRGSYPPSLSSSHDIIAQSAHLQTTFWMWRSIFVKPIDRALLCFPPKPFLSL